MADIAAEKPMMKIQGVRKSTGTVRRLQGEKVAAMPVFRVERIRNYTTKSNYHLRDRNLSLIAKGLLSMCLSLTESWDYSVNGLTAISKEGRDAILSAVRELEQAGYIVRSRERDERGCLRGAAYTIYEVPKLSASSSPGEEKPVTENPTQENSALANPVEENPGQLNTNKPNTELTKYRGKKESRHHYGRYENVLLTDEELGKLKAEFPADYAQRIERLSEYMGSTGKSYKNHLITIRSWARRDKPQNKGYSHEAYRFQEGESL